jgi:Sec-independent protein translocase protein TatA
MWTHHRLAEGIGYWEVLLIVLVLFILFGHRLPGMMRLWMRGPWD